MSLVAVAFKNKFCLPRKKSFVMMSHFTFICLNYIFLYKVKLKTKQNTTPNKLTPPIILGDVPELLKVKRLVIVNFIHMLEEMDSLPTV